jgi:phosphoglycolate phosphatase-like HAD superfamily hydrolase
VLRALDLVDFFDEVLGGDGPLPRKPDPTALRTLIAQSGGLPAMLVGDSPIDAQTAAACGCPFVWARYGFGAARFEAPPSTPYVLDRPSDLAEVLDRIERIEQGS